MGDAKSKIREFLNKELGVQIDAVSDDDLLFTSGLIDSFSLIEMLAFMESEFNRKIDITDLNIDELDTINALTNLVM